MRPRGRQLSKPGPVQSGLVTCAPGGARPTSSFEPYTMSPLARIMSRATYPQQTNSPTNHGNAISKSMSLSVRHATPSKLESLSHLWPFVPTIEPWSRRRGPQYVPFGDFRDWQCGSTEFLVRLRAMASVEVMAG